MKFYIGLSTTPHDPSIAVVNEAGEPLFAEATERHLQDKRAWNAVPDNMLHIGDVLAEHCRGATELVVATTWSRRYIETFRLLQPITRQMLRAFPMAFRLYSGAIGDSLWMLNKQAGNNLRVMAYKRLGVSKIEARSFDHHMCHAAAACFASPFEEAACAIVDGFGEGENTALFHYRAGELKRLRFPRGLRAYGSSLGTFYSILCAACGFEPIQGEEWKVMGLAPYGKFRSEYYKLFEQVLEVRDGAIVLGSNARAAIATMYATQRKPGTPALECADLAFTGQQFFCDTMYKFLDALQRRTGSKNLVLGGGCALNSSCNGTVLAHTAFEQLYVSSAPADDGNALGAAFLAQRKDQPRSAVSRAKSRVLTPYLGSTVKPQTMDRLVRYGRITHRSANGKPVYREAAELLANGRILAWVQGRAEWGPRALGNRSILADPRDASVKQRLNDEVKFREEFRPFAPSVLHQYGEEYFEDYQESPYMERTLRFRDSVVHRVPGVVHVDQTGRLQTVRREWNERYYDLIDAFRELTGVPMLLNTSLNVMGKPIVHSLEDALSVFLTSGIDALVVNDEIFVKPS